MATLKNILLSAAAMAAVLLFALSLKLSDGLRALVSFPCWIRLFSARFEYLSENDTSCKL